MGLAPGDYVEIAVQKKHAILKPKKVVDVEDPIGPKTRAAIQKALKKIKAGNGHGPFKSAKALITDLHRRAKPSK